MIRDPSDGSVREKPESEVGIPVTKPVEGKSHPTEISGLPFASQKPENLARLERSREQLKRYHETGKWNDRSDDG